MEVVFRKSVFSSAISLPFSHAQWSTCSLCYMGAIS